MDSNLSQITSLLEWYEAIGVTEAIANEPRNYLDKTASLSKEREKQSIDKKPSVTTYPDMAAKKSSSTSPLIAPPEAVAQAAALVDKCTTLSELYNAIRAFDGCPLKKTAINTVTHDGVETADILVIGEAPGADEDRQGIPFCGMSGKLLDKIFASIGLSRETNLLITNSIYWRPPGNRKPTTEEIAICKPFVTKHIALSKPSLLLLVGGVSTQAVLDNKTGITRLRGRLHKYHCPLTNTTIDCIPLLHPAYLLRQSGQKAFMWQDMLTIQKLLAA